MNDGEDRGYSVLVVEDDRSTRIMLQAELEKSFEVICAESGETCISMCESVRPDLVLLDVSMPGIDGYETCRKLRENHALNHVPIVFLSAKTDVDDKLKGYDAGGDHYIAKPCDFDELNIIIDKAIRQRKSWQEELSNTFSLARTAMSNSGELGTVVQFYEESFQCCDLHSLACALLSACEVYGLDCCTQIRGSREIVSLATGGQACKSIEEELMCELIGKKRILAFGHRTTFNFDKVSLLVKNMPLDDSDKVGRLNDHVASLLNGVEVRTQVFDFEIEKEQQILSKVREALDDIDGALKKVERVFSTRDAKTADIIDQLLTQMNSGFSDLALTEEQEEFFIGLVNNSMDEITALYAASGEVGSYFQRISERLSAITR
ncbi:response regulator [Exilibacterium tricleocarpae]|uniref:Response regulator n=1 Tax=Exilibacterium tricleocarpae TaxID=2591008 RepID=A0A545U3X6_9GAMM|nr:response regulator [Exilibacterium tricleocarpae]TQV84168.1 response regulator [Exilibacterium tricleocarpae]